MLGCSGVFYFFGGMLQILGAVMEWIIGNTFPTVVFASYGSYQSRSQLVAVGLERLMLALGAFWLSLAATLQPTYNAMGAYVDPTPSQAAQAAGKAEYYNTYGQ